MIDIKLMKKIISFILLFFLFYLSYIFKSFQLLLISSSFLILCGFFYKKINKNLLVFLFSFFLTFTCIELFLLYLNNGKILEISNKRNFSQNISYEKSFLGYQPTPGVQKHKVVSNGKIRIDSKYTIGSNKFRVTPKINNLERNKTMNFFGGSFVFGWGLNDNETLPYLTQKYFKKWNINNFGISGYGVHQTLALIKKNEATIKDVNILITHKFHVPRTTCKRDYSFGTPKYILNKKKKLIRKGYCNNANFKNIQLPKIVGSIINRSEIKKLVDRLYFRKVDFNKNSIELYLSIIYEIDKIISKKEKYFFVGYIIENQKNEIDDYILKKLDKNNIKIINLTLDPKNKKYQLPDGHPNKEANKKRSLMISNFLKNHQLSN